jgi:hypothetical protein
LILNRFISKGRFSSPSGSGFEGQTLKNPKTRSFKHILAIASKKSLKTNMQFLSTFLDIFDTQNPILFAMLFRSHQKYHFLMRFYNRDDAIGKAFFKKALFLTIFENNSLRRPCQTKSFHSGFFCILT